MAEVQQKVQSVFDKAINAQDGPAGCVFGAVDKTGKVLVKVAAGKAELGNESRPMRTDSVFCFYSCTKMIAGIAIMQLVEQGKINLDDPVGDVLPEVENARFPDGRKPNKRITLRHLLTHTAGYGYTFFNPEIKEWSEKNGGLDEFGGSIEGFNSPLIAEPGEDWHYSVGIDWAGEYLHRVTGQKLGDYCMENIFKPLGATDIAFGLLPKHKGRLVAMHQRAPDGKLSVRDHLPFTYKSTFDSGGAGTIGTIDDYMKIMVVLMNDGVGGNGTRILKSETVKEMWEDQIEHLTSNNTAEKPNPMERLIENPNPELTDAIQMMPGVTKGWGITFQLLKDDLPTGRKGTSGWWAGLPNNYWAVDPKSGIATMILSQSFPFNDMRVIGPWLEAEAEVYKGLA